MPRIRPSDRALVTLLALSTVLLPLFPASSQPPPIRAPENTPIFGEEVDVRVVNVEVVVTDKQGNRVTGLSPKDFRLRVDGKDVPVQYFSEVHEGQAVAAPPPGSTGTASQPAELPNLTAGKAVGTSYLVFVDDYFSHAAQRNVG